MTARLSDVYTGPSTDTAYYFNVPLPTYSIAAARASLVRDNWSATLFVDNLANKQALMTANNTSFQFNIPQLTRYTVNQPRTVGTQVNYKFCVRCETQPMALKNKETIVALKIYIRTLFPLLWVESLSQSARIDLRSNPWKRSRT